MEKSEALTALAALAQESRLDIYRLLVEAGAQGLPAGHIGDRVGLPSATLAFHLKKLKRAGLVGFTRNGRSLIYAAVYPAMTSLLSYLTENCCRGHPARVFNVLFLCTGNAARSILAECILTQLGSGHFIGFSAGSFPRGKIHPLALRLITEQGIPTDSLRSKSWNEFASPGAPVMDFVFTVCDRAAGEVCPIWPGQPVTAHWGIPDPAAAEGTETERTIAFRDTFSTLERRLKIIVALPVDKLDRMALQRRVDAIGRKPIEATENPAP